MHYVRNTFVVLIVTALTAVAVYAGVEVVAGAAAVGTPGSPDPTDTVAIAGQRYLCPRTGCTATTCHGATGSAPPAGGGMGRMRSSGRSYRGRGTSHTYQPQGDLTFQ
jgi:hypothetical protein